MSTHTQFKKAFKRLSDHTGTIIPLLALFILHYIETLFGFVESMEESLMVMIYAGVSLIIWDVTLITMLYFRLKKEEKGE